jgi:parallel beta-helix repeat protein
VTLTVTGPSGVDTETKADYINVYALPPAVAFIADPMTGEAPLTVQFTNQSLGDITIYNWDFGDGSFGIDLNPSHIYQSAGEYTVTLTAIGPGGTSTETKIDYIQVIRTNHAPQVELIYPQGREVWAGLRDIVWVAKDADGDPLAISIDYRLRTASEWTNIVSGEVNDSVYRWDTTSIADGSNYSIRVVANDGETQGEDQSDSALTIGNTLPIAEITSPNEGRSYRGMIEIIGTAYHPAFKSYTLEYLTSAGWVLLQGPIPTPVIHDLLTVWDVHGLAERDYTLRLTVTLRDDSQIQDSVNVSIAQQDVILQVPYDYPTIQTAIDAASSKIPMAILVEPGNYPGNLDLSGKPVRVISAKDFRVTTVVGNVLLNSGEDEDAMLDGLTVYGTIIIGKGRTLSPRIMNCRIVPTTGEPALVIGGASKPKILSNVIEARAAATAGIWIEGTSAPEVSSNVIKYFTTAGITIRDSAKPTIRNNLVITNGDSANPISGGLQILGNAEPLIVSNTFHGNRGNTVYLQGLGVQPTFINNIFEGTASTRVFWCDQGAQIGSFRFNDMVPVVVEGCNDPRETLGFLSQDPLFVDISSGDYQLKDLSPAIDAGDGYAGSLLDAHGKPRYDDRQMTNRGIGGIEYVDIGALERQIDSVEGGGEPCFSTVESVKSGDGGRADDGIRVLEVSPCLVETLRESGPPRKP